MTPFHQSVINDLLATTSRLLDAAKRDENGRFVEELRSAERCANYAREQLQRRTVLDLDGDDDDL